MAFVNVSTTSVNKVSDTKEKEQSKLDSLDWSKKDSDLDLKEESDSAVTSSNTYVQPQRKLYKRFECKDCWWKGTVIYEVYVRSFYDSNNDGIGDLKGIEEKLDYFKYLGVNTLWLTPMYPSPMVDFGYDISDFNGIDPMFGTMDDFKKLMRSMKDKELKLVLDFVPNHTSDQHEWFRASVLQQEPYTDYYVWKSPKEFDVNGLPIPPNNWRSVFGGSAWHYNEKRKQFHLHQFAKEQPDLNFRNPLVIQEMVNIINFWLELGVDGFRLDAAPHILEDEEFRNNPPAKLDETNSFTEDDYCFWDHTFTCDCAGVLDILTTFRSVCNEWSLKDGHERVLMTEGYLPLPDLMKYYGTEATPIAHFSFNFELLGLNKDCTASQVLSCITKWLDALPDWCWPNWQTGNHDQPRVCSKLGEDFVDLMNMILLLLPGTAITYYGEEIGMENTNISYEETKDPAGKNAGPERFHLFSRDPERSPMQWDANTCTAGFSVSTTPWLPINPNYLKMNVRTETEVDRSHLKIYKILLSLRKSQAWQKGDLDIRILCNNSVLAFTRVDVDSGEGLLVVTNFSKKAANVACQEFDHVPQSDNVIVVVSVTDSVESYSEGSTIVDGNIKLNGRSGMACKFFAITS